LIRSGSRFQNIIQHFVQVWEKAESVPVIVPVPGKNQPRSQRSTFHGFLEGPRRIIDNDVGAVEENGFVQREVQVIVGETVPLKPAFRRLPRCRNAVTGQDDAEIVLLE